MLKFNCLLILSIKNDYGENMLNWINVEDSLPEFDKRVVICLHNSQTVHNGKRVLTYFAARRPDKPEGNNCRDYSWSGDGPMNYFGQSVAYWAELGEEPITVLYSW